MILPVKKIVEEFYHDTSRLKKKLFCCDSFMTPVAVNFVNFSVC